MLITVLIRRTAAQQVTASASWWAVGQGLHEMHRVTWDPAGPLRAREALQEGLVRLLDEITWRREEPAPPAFDQPPLPGL